LLSELLLLASGDVVWNNTLHRFLRPLQTLTLYGVDALFKLLTFVRDRLGLVGEVEM
jgi:hypothetical protein